MAVAAFCSTCGSALVGGKCVECAPAVAVALTHAPFPNVADAAPDTYKPGAQYIGKWNWGAFCLCPFWLMNHGRMWMGILYIVLAFIPLVNIFGCIGMAIVFGIKGNEVAVAHRSFANDEQFVAVQNAWRNWGIPIYFGPFLILIITSAGVAIVSVSR